MLILSPENLGGDFTLRRLCESVQLHSLCNLLYTTDMQGGAELADKFHNALFPTVWSPGQSAYRGREDSMSCQNLLIDNMSIESRI